LKTNSSSQKSLRDKGIILCGTRQSLSLSLKDQFPQIIDRVIGQNSHKFRFIELSPMDGDLHMPWS